MVRCISKLLRKKFLPEQLEERALLAVLAGDAGSAFEPNETLDTAADLGSVGGGLFVQGQTIELEARIGDFTNGVATNTSDVDIYRVELRAGDRVTFDIDAQRLDDGDELFDPEAGNTESNSAHILRLFRRDDEANFTLLASNTAAVAPDDSTTDNTIDPAIVDFVVPSTDTYYIGVSGESEAGNNYNPLVATGRNATERTGQYILKVTAIDDDAERPDVDVVVPNLSDGEANVVSWTIQDESGISESQATIWKDDIIIRPNDPVPLSGSFDLGEFGAGDFRITITAVDDDNDWLGDRLTNIHSVLFTIGDDDTSGPDIQLTPASSLDGADNFVAWDITDESGFEIITADILRNGVTIFSGNIDPIGSFGLDSEGIGDYSITVNATDSDSDSFGDSLTSTLTLPFTIRDDDQTPPTPAVSLPVENDGRNNIALWEVSDASGLANVDVVITRDGEVILDSDEDPVGEFDLNSFGIGNYTVRVTALDADDDWVGDQLQATTSTDVVSITDDDTEIPQIEIIGPGASDARDNKIAWSVSDDSGLQIVEATILHGEQVLLDATVDSVDDFDLNSFGPGSYTVTIDAIDADDDWAGDELSATQTMEFTITDDDTTAPEISIVVPNESDRDENVASWSVFDPAGLTTVDVQVTKNGVSIFNSDELSQGLLDLDSEGPGEYVITVAALDRDNDWVGDETESVVSEAFTITDDDVETPTITVNLADDVDGANNIVTWEITDASGLETTTATITQGLDVLFDGPIATTGEYDLNSFGLGTFQVEINATDADDDWVGDASSSSAAGEFTVTDDDDAAPTIAVAVESQTDGELNEASWVVEDPSGVEQVTVQVTRDNLPIFDRPVEAVDSINVDAFGPGVYTIAVRAEDADSDWVGDSRISIQNEAFTITDDDTDAPNIAITSGDARDGADNRVTWSVTDASGLATVAATISRNGVNVFSEEVDADGWFEVNEFGIGNYSVTVRASDADDDWANDPLSNTATSDFVVIDDDTEVPSIEISSGVEDGLNNIVSWTVTDSSGLASVSATISKDGEVISEGDVEARGSLDLNPFGIGNYSISVSAVDADQDWEGDELGTTLTEEFSVGDDDTEAPSIVFNDPNTNDGLNNVVTWTVTDPSGVSSVTATITRGDLVLLDANEVEAIDSFDLNEVGSGDYTITISATDADNDRVEDQVGITQSMDFVITDDDTVAPRIEFDAPAATDGADNKASWTVGDDSGVKQVVAVVSKDGGVIFRGEVTAQSSFDLNEFGVGSYSLRIDADDADGDWVGDTSTTSEEFAFSISDDDTTPPEITITSPSELDRSDNIVSWAIADVSGVSAASVSISKDGQSIFDSDANNTNSFNLDSFGPGAYSITVSATDGDVDTAGDQLSATATESFTIADEDTDPPNITISLANDVDGSNNLLMFDVSDESGLQSISAKITAGDAVLLDGPIPRVSEFDLNNFGLGTFQVEVTAMDADADWAGDSLTATQTREFTITDDDDDSPAITITPPEATDGGNYVASWVASDISGIARATVQVTLNGNPIIDGPVSANDSVDLSQFGPGEYTVTVRADDADSDWVGDSRTSIEDIAFAIVDDDVEAPSIVIDEGAARDDGNNTISWQVTDASGLALVTVEIVREGLTITSGPEEPNGSVDVNLLGTGSYQATVTATDADDDTPGDQLTATTTTQFTITDDDTVAPQVVLNNANGSTDGADNVVSWELSDDSGISEVNATITKDGNVLRSGPIDVGQTSFDLNEFGIGDYSVSLEVVDGDEDWVGDRSSQITTSEFSITDDDISGPVIAISPPSGSTQSEVLENSFSWVVTDDGSGLSSGFVRVERELADGSFELVDQQAIEVNDSQTTVSGETTLDAFGLGNFRLVIGATDADTDRDGDQSSSEASSFLSVVDPTAPKVIASSGGTNSEFDRLGTVRFVFDEDVSASLDANDFELRNTSTDEVFAITEDFVWDPAALAASIDLSGRELLSKGLYAVVLKSAGVTDAAGNVLDGDGEGTSGGDHVAGTFPITWKGDATLNADVEFEDFLIVSDNYGQQVNGWGDGDFDGNGTVDFQDFLWVTWNWDQVPTPIDAAQTLPTQTAFTQFEACSNSVRATAEGRNEALEISIRNPALLEPNTPTTLNIGGDVVGFFYDEPSAAFWCNDALDPDATEPRAVTSRAGSVTVTLSAPYPSGPAEPPIDVTVVVNDLLFQTENGQLSFDDFRIEAGRFGFLPG